MSVLSDKTLKERLDSRSIVVDPLEDPDLQIQPSSVDVRLGNDIKFFDMGVQSVNPEEDDVEDVMESQIVEYGDWYTLMPGDFVLGTTIERVEIPPDLVAELKGRSSYGRLGIEIHATAGLLDPGFQGQVTLEISNTGTVPIELRPGVRIAQIVFKTLTEEAERPYGEREDSKYQDQEGAQVSRAGEDPETLR